MEKVAGHTNLFRRNATYYLRRRVPSDVLDSFGKKELCYSLKTKDYQEALKRIRIESAKVESQFEEHRQELKRLSSPPLDDLSSEQLQNIHDVYYQYILEEDDETRLEGFYRGEMTENPVPSFEEYKEDIDTFEQATRGGYAEGVSNEFYLSEAMEVLSWSEVSLNVTEGSLAHKKVARKIQEAAIRAYESIQSRNKGALVDTPDRPQKPLSESLSASNTPLLSEIKGKWIKEKSRSSWTENVARDHGIWVDVFITLNGDRPFNEYTKADVLKFKELLLMLPANWKKKVAIRDLRIDKAAQKAERVGMEPMSAKNARKIFQYVGGLWRYMYGHYDELDRNIFEGITIEVNSDKRKERHSFTKEGLKIIFTSPLYKGCQSGSRCHLSGDVSMKDTAKYWVPLIALYTGMRLGEILQLYLGDLKEKDGIHYFDINANGEDKTLKTRTSERLMPIHEDLIALGLIKFIQNKKSKKKTQRVFDDVSRSSDRTYSDAFSKFFSRYLKEIQVKTDKNSFHSFRHTFEDACREAGVPKEIMDALQGHSSQDMSGRYGSGYSLHKLNEWLQKVDYGGVIIL